MVNESLILKELIRRGKVFDKKSEKHPVFPLDKFCFDKQLSFIKDPSRFKCAVTSRRAGKTHACSADLLTTATAIPGSNSLYLTLSRASAKKIIWSDILKLNKLYKLGGVANQSELTLTFPHLESTIYLSGAGDKGQIEKFRGMSLQKIYIDESQAFGSYFEDFLEDILTPCLYDTNGSLILIGTPNASCSGPLFDAYHKIGLYKGWTSHHWTLIDNPHIKRKTGKDPDKILQEEINRKGITRDHPSFQRESLGRWVRSTDSLVYKYSAEKNDYQKLPQGHQWHYVMGVDLGWSDADAIVILAFSEDLPDVYLVDEWTESKKTISDLANKIKYFETKYDFIKKVIDTGGLGKKITEELGQRFGLHLEPAEKTRKHEFIELMNDDLRKGRLKIKYKSLTYQEMAILQWDPNAARPIEDKRYKNHLCDSILYAWREAKHYTYEDPIGFPAIGTAEYYRKVEDQLEQEVIDSLRKGDDDEDELFVSYEEDDDWFRS
jgi:hypothetical protein